MIAISNIKKEYGSSMALILLCCRIHFKTAQLDDLSNFIDTTEIDWSGFYKNCLIHKIRPLVYRIILKTELPEAVKKRISNELNKLTIKSFEQARETERLIYLLQESKIDVIPYKGTAFSKYFFGNISMRESSDIDIIINPDAIPKAIKILEKDGFIASQKEYYQWIGHKKFIKKHKDFSFDKYIGDKRQYHIELHFNIINKTTHLPDNRNIFDTNQTNKILIFQKEINCLNAIEHFRAVALHHMLMDNMGYLKTVVDIAQILIEVETLQKKDKINSVNHILLEEVYTKYNLALIENAITAILGVNLKENTKTKLEDSLIKRILSSSYRKVRKNKLPIFDAIFHHYIQLKYTSYFYNKTIDKTIYLFKNTISLSYPQPDDCMAVKLDKNLYSLYYFIRPFRLIFFPSTPRKN